MSEGLRFGFLGAGKMATALAAGWLRAGLASRDRIMASDPLLGAREGFAATTGAFVTSDNLHVVNSSDVIILAVKPQTLHDLLSEVRAAFSPQALTISIAAGITIRQLQQMLPGECRLVRVMPNTPCLVGSSATGFTPAATATEDDIALVDRLFNAVGKAYRLPEHLLDAVTGLSGSGPAFVAVIIEALADAGVRMGLPRTVALNLAAQTVLGTAKMILKEGYHPARLKDDVASPGGTTMAGLFVLEKSGVRAALMEAVEAATRRATELGKSRDG
jgi:pyrroline-5-carboxylate reductase